MATEPFETNKSAYLSIAVLLAIAIAAAMLRTSLRTDEGLPAGDTAWSVRITHIVETADDAATIALPPPWDTRHARLYSQSITHLGLRQRRSGSDKKNRDIMLTTSKAGEYTISSQFNIYVSHMPLTTSKKTGLSEQNRAAWLSSSRGIEINTPATEKVVDVMARDKPEPDKLIERLFNFVSNNIRIDPNASNDSEKALDSKRASALGSTRALLALMRSAHLPARIVTGVNLQNQTPLPLFWGEVYDGNRWIPVDPANGYMNELPIYYIPLRKGDDRLLLTENAKISSTSWEILLLPTYKGMLSSETKRLTDILDLTRLPLQSREMLSILLLLPIGVLATELIRQFAGIRTYGTFTPTLLALAVMLVDWATAAIVLALVTVIGVALRSTMPELNLQRTPRLAIVFTLVAMSMSIVVSGINYADPSSDSTVTLLPLVILTMLVDRIYTVYDESGLQTAIVRLGWTVAAAIVSLFVLLQSHWGTFLVSFPETHAVTLALIIMFGLYKGPRLKNIPAFHWLREPVRRKRNRQTDISQREQSGDNT